MAAAAALAVALLAPSHAAAGPGAPEGTDFRGSWVLNKELSADPIGGIEGRRRTGRRPLGGPGPGTGGGLGGPLIGGRGGYDRPDPDERARMREMLRMIMDAPEFITITLDGRVVVVTSRDGRVQRLKPDGRKTAEVTETGLELERKTRWDDGELVSDFSVKDSGGKARQTWARDGDRLVVTTRIEPPDTPDPLVVRRVYDLE